MSEAAGPDREELARRELFAVLAHELRSPIGAILGFEELLSEGILGELPLSTHDALGRIRGSALQLLELVAGLSDLAGDPRAEHPLSLHPVDLEALLGETMGIIEPEIAGRGGTLSRLNGIPLPTFVTDPDRVRRALLLALMAAIKTTAGGGVAVEASSAPAAVTVRIHGSRLDPARDDPDRSLHEHEHARITGAGLRIAMARTALDALGGTLVLRPHEQGNSLVLTLPRQSEPG